MTERPLVDVIQEHIELVGSAMYLRYVAEALTSIPCNTEEGRKSIRLAAVLNDLARLMESYNDRE